jgi:hypothetical protein
MSMAMRVVNTSSAERCWSTYSFIHNVRRNRLNVQRAKNLVYVHYNLRLLSHYCEDPTIDKANKMWDYNPEEDNLEDGALVLEELENALLDEDDRAKMPPPSARSHGRPPLTSTPPVPALEGPSHSIASSSLPHAYPHEGIVVVEGDRSRRNRLFFILLDFSLIIIVVLMQIANFCKQNYLAMTHVDN